MTVRSIGYGAPSSIEQEMEQAREWAREHARNRELASREAAPGRLVPVAPAPRTLTRPRNAPAAAVPERDPWGTVTACLGELRDGISTGHYAASRLPRGLARAHAVVTAAHEAGHALLLLAIGGQLQRVTIRPQGERFGMCLGHLPVGVSSVERAAYHIAGQVVESEVSPGTAIKYSCGDWHVIRDLSKDTRDRAQSCANFYFSQGSAALAVVKIAGLLVRAPQHEVSGQMIRDELGAKTIADLCAAWHRAQAQAAKVP